ncbi:MAG: biopolymer transporter ExbD [Bacteroidales bacterium]|nr:biopolymer transporter ExbD [Bacteroidales bacterium]
MAIQTRNKRKTDFSMASMSDIVFLLLIFFMLTSTLVAPNAIKLLLPASNSRTIEKPPKIIISINHDLDYFLQGVQVDEQSLENGLLGMLAGKESASIRLEADKNIPVQYVVNVIDIVNNVNKKYNAKHKVILATSPKR